MDVVWTNRAPNSTVKPSGGLTAFPTASQPSSGLLPLLCMAGGVNV